MPHCNSFTTLCIYKIQQFDLRTPGCRLSGLRPDKGAAERPVKSAQAATALAALDDLLELAPFTCRQARRLLSDLLAAQHTLDAGDHLSRQ